MNRFRRDCSNAACSFCSRRRSFCSTYAEQVVSEKQEQTVTEQVTHQTFELFLFLLVLQLLRSSIDRDSRVDRDLKRSHLHSAQKLVV